MENPRKTIGYSHTWLLQGLWSENLGDRGKRSLLKENIDKTTMSSTCRIFLVIFTKHVFFG